ncbi:hypothetical protein AAC387_Pa03g1985 [Persea americana]
MAPSRRLSNGRSPLVNQQRQITSFFTPGKSSASPSPSSSKKNPNPKPSSSPSTPNPSPSTPQTSQNKKKKKPLLVIGPSPSPASAATPSPPKSGNNLCSEAVVGKRVRVFWPLDKTWYEGSVKSFDKQSSKHVVQYDDAEEEVLDLRKEKIEWVEDQVRSFRRLRRKSVPEEVEVEEKVSDDGSGGDDDSTDEDWGKSAGKETGDVDSDGDDDSEELELVEEDEEIGSAKRPRAGDLGSRKRKVIEQEKSGSGKKSRGGGIGEMLGLKVAPGKPVEPATNLENAFANTLMGDTAERFGRREAEKLGFLGPGRRDACRRLPGDENYDPRTLYLPPIFLKSLSGGQRQWWEFKSKHMDKVLFFKMGKFYELFEMDAHIGAKELDLQYMKGEQPHCGFPEKNFSVNVEKLARKGYRVLVVEQTETPEQLELRRKETGSKDKVVKREICAVVTKGTLIEGEMLSLTPDAAYLISVTESCKNIENQKEEEVVLGICLVDVSTSRFILGQFADDLERHCLCSILAELRPVEIIKPAKSLSCETERVLLQHTRSPLVNDLVPALEFWSAEKAVYEVRNVFGLNKDSRVSKSLNDESTCIPADSESAGGFLNASQKQHMILDAAALENLEIFENNRNGGSSGTLFAQLDHCVSAFGKRLLKNWLARPLCHLGSIMNRQDAIASLKGVANASALFRRELSKLPDMERLLARLFASCESNGRNANKVILYEDATKKQVQEFVIALRGCETMAQACSSLSSVLDNSESSLLSELLTLGKGFPDIDPVLKHFKDAFDWLEADRTGRIFPHEGVDVEYDSACRIVNDVKCCLERHLKEQQKAFGDESIKYVTVGKDEYLLEVPESLQGVIPRDYELQSSKKGFFRYWTPKIKKWLVELSQAEAEKETRFRGILQRLVGRFCEHHNKWRQLVSATAELDVLISLAIVSDYYEGPMCRPTITATLCSSEAAPCLSAKTLGHPVIRGDALGNGSFVPNDVNLGGPGCASFILLTGPNMGGKSTLLRQICLAVILAQVGADVPAESFVLSPVDRIFVRMGARDHIMAGQSTFLTELSETAAILSSATRNSLVALDELGRGTSTSDGQAIAESVLEHLVRKIECRGLFSTHYHRLAVDYEKDPKVSLCHMGCRVGKGIGGVEEVTFLYRLTPGACPKSYGVNVARLAGLPDSVLQKASAMSNEFEAIYGMADFQVEFSHQRLGGKDW